MITSPSRIVVASSLHPKIGSQREVRLYEEYEHVSFIEIDGYFLVIEPVTDDHPHRGDLVLDGRQCYAFVEESECENTAQARSRCEEYERDWRSHDWAYEQQKRTIEWREFLLQPVDVQGIADEYDLFESTILDYIDKLTVTRQYESMTNGDIVTLIERDLADRDLQGYTKPNFIEAKRFNHVCKQR